MRNLPCPWFPRVLYCVVLQNDIQQDEHNWDGQKIRDEQRTSRRRTSPFFHVTNALVLLKSKDISYGYQHHVNRGTLTRRSPLLSPYSGVELESCLHTVTTRLAETSIATWLILQKLTKAGGWQNPFSLTQGGSKVSAALAPRQREIILLKNPTLPVCL